MNGLNNRESGIQAGPVSNGGRPASHLQDKGGIDMTTDIDRAEVFSRPAARFDEDGQLEIRASSALGCRRALWYAATGYEPANPPSEDSLTAMEAGNALEPVVLRAMERAGGQVSPADPQDPEAVSVRIGPNLLVTGHPDATGRMPLDGEEADSEVQAFLFGGGPAAPAYGGEMVVEVKTRGPEAFKRWRTLGAERSHPASVAQAAFYTLGTYGELRTPPSPRWTRATERGTTKSSPPTGWNGPCRTPANGWASLPPTTSRTGLTPTRCRSGTSRQAAGSAGPAPSWRSACRVRRRPTTRRRWRERR